MNEGESGAGGVEVEVDNCARCGRLLPIEETADMANGEVLEEVDSLSSYIQGRYRGYLCLNCIVWLTEDEEAEEEEEEANGAKE